MLSEGPFESDMDLVDHIDSKSERSGVDDILKGQDHHWISRVVTAAAVAEEEKS